MQLSVHRAYASTAHKETFVAHQGMTTTCESWRGAVRNPPLRLGSVEHPELQVDCFTDIGVTFPSQVTPA